MSELRHYYNEFDRPTAAWLAELGAEGLVPEGFVDRTDIRGVHAATVRSYQVCHFFAGIGGWAEALRLAGWPSDRPVWTGSCPCQPFSVAGKGLGEKDPRHLWPCWFRLIKECRPATIFGEQVDNAVKQGWLDGVFADLEAEGYACGSAVLGAHSVNSPHKRQRAYWVATLPDTYSKRPQRLRPQHQLREGEKEEQTLGRGETPFWSRYTLFSFRDGRRRIEPSIKPLAHGVQARVVRLRGYGNAIVPQVAATFIKAFLEAETEVTRE